MVAIGAVGRRFAKTGRADRRRAAAVLAFSFFCVVVAAALVYTIEYRVRTVCASLKEMVVSEQCYWAAAAGAERAASVLDEPVPSLGCRKYLALLEGQPPPDWFSGAEIGGCRYEVSPVPYQDRSSGFFNVEDENGFINVNHCPGENEAFSDTRIRWFRSTGTIEDPAALAAKIDGWKPRIRENRKRGDDGRWFKYDYFRHPYELLVACDSFQLFGCDSNENGLDDPGDDRGDRDWTRGLSAAMTTDTVEAKVNPYTCAPRLLHVVLFAFPRVEAAVEREKDRVASSVRSGRPARWKDPYDLWSCCATKEEQIRYMRFSTALTRDVSSVRITVQVYRPGGDWYGRLVQVLGRDDDGDGWIIRRRRFERGL